MTTQENDLPQLDASKARKGEGLLLVIQNNEDKSLIISGMNETLETMLGYAKGEVIDQKLETILGKNEAQMLADDLEYVDDAPDFGDLFSRIRDVRLRRRVGDEIRVDCTLSRLMAQGHHACFQIVIPNEHERIRSTNLSEFIALNLEGRKEVDEATGLPNHKTAKEFLPLLKNYFADTETEMVFAVLRMDRHEKSVARYGKAACEQLLRHTASCCRSAFRADDLIFALSDHTLGVVLFDISRESSRVVFNRLRWQIRSHRIAFGGKADFSVTTCIGFDMLNTDEPTEEVFERCEKAMAELDANERNALVELSEA